MGKPTGLAKKQQRALGRLTELPSMGRFYLGGGSAIAWYLHHRRSNDLDLFSDSKVDLGRVSRAVQQLGDTRIIARSDATLKVELSDTLVDIVSYPYAPLEPPAEGPAGFRVASLIDLAVMKLAAVARRGIRRDFWDLRVLIDGGLTLEQIARAYIRRFRVAEGDLYPVLRSLTYFEDAEKDEVFPDGLSAKSWEGIKSFFRERAGEAARQLLGSGRGPGAPVRRGRASVGTRRRRPR